MNLLKDESVLLESQSKRLILTTHRVRYVSPLPDRIVGISIMLEEVDSCAFVHTTFPALSITAGVFFVAGLFMNNIILLAVALVFVIAYFTIRPPMLIIASAKAMIKVNAADLGVGFIERFIDKVEEAKDARYLLGRWDK